MIAQDPPVRGDSAGPNPDPRRRRRQRRLGVRLALLTLLVAGLTAFLVLDGPEMLSFEAFTRHRDALATWVTEHRLSAMLAFFGLYVALVVFSIPGALWMSIAGGYLFGTAIAAALIVAAATLGATGVFLAARTILGDGWRQRCDQGSLGRLATWLRDNAFSGLVVLRLLPVFPFWLVNLAPAALGVSLRIYVLATLLGVIPGSIVFASLGNGLDHLLAQGKTPDLSLIRDPQILGPLLGLAVLAALPMLWRRRKGSDA